MISVKEALELVMETAIPLGVETVSVHDAIGRTLAEDVYADRSMPPFDRVTMDGICIDVLCSVGKMKVNVSSNPKVAVISSGDELVEIDQKPKEYQIRKSNVYMLQSRLQELGVSADTFHFADDTDSIYDEMKSLLDRYHVLLMKCLL